MNAFHSTNLFCCFSRYQAPTNSVTPSSCKPHVALYVSRYVTKSRDICMSMTSCKECFSDSRPICCCMTVVVYGSSTIKDNSLFKAGNTHTTHNSLIRSNEGLMLETSALYGSQFTLSAQLIKPN